jgi:hypothetical protein
VIPGNASELIKMHTAPSGGRGFESRRSPNFLELQSDLRQATLVLTMLKFRIALISRIGGWPKTRLRKTQGCSQRNSPSVKGNDAVV